MIANIQPIQNYIVHDVPVTCLSIDTACNHLYCTSLIDVAYLIIAKSDHDPLAKQLEEGTNTILPDGVSAEEYRNRRFSRLTKYINQATGRLMDVFISNQLSAGTIIFGLYQTLETSGIPALSKQDILAGKF